MEIRPLRRAGWSTEIAGDMTHEYYDVWHHNDSFIWVKNIRDMTHASAAPKSESPEGHDSRTSVTWLARIIHEYAGHYSCVGHKDPTWYMTHWHQQTRFIWVTNIRDTTHESTAPKSHQRHGLRICMSSQWLVINESITWICESRTWKCMTHEAASPRSLETTSSDHLGHTDYQFVALSLVLRSLCQPEIWGKRRSFIPSEFPQPIRTRETHRQGVSSSKSSFSLTKTQL